MQPLHMLHNWITCEGDTVLSCVCGVAEPFDNFGRGPMLTDVEMENQYREVYKRAAAKDSSAEVNLVTTTFLPAGQGPSTAAHCAWHARSRAEGSSQLDSRT